MDEGGRELYTWGRGGHGRLGHGDQNDKLVPTVVEGPLQGRRVVRVAQAAAGALGAAQELGGGVRQGEGRGQAGA